MILILATSYSFKFSREIIIICCNMLCDVYLYDVSCFFKKRAVLEVGLTNPVNQNLPLGVTVTPSNEGLSGDKEITLPPCSRGVYTLEYAPAIVGNYTARYATKT